MTRLHLISCLGVESDLPYLPHFLAHYRALGVPPKAMHIILQARDPATPELSRAQATLAAAGIAPAKVWIAPYTSTTMWDERRALQARVAGSEDWVLSADMDEFHDYPAPLPEIVAWCEKTGCEAIQGPFIDRLAADGRLAPIPPPETPLDRAFPLRTELRHAIAGYGGGVDLGGSVNLMLHRGRVLPSVGGHGPVREQRDGVRYAYGRALNRFAAMRDPAFRFTLPFLVHHYKWTDGLMARVQRRLDTPGITDQGRAYAEALVGFFDRNQAATEAMPLDRLPHLDARPDAGPDMPWRARVAQMRRLHRRQQIRDRLVRLGRLAAPHSRRKVA